MELLALYRELAEVVVVLHDVVLEPILAQDPDAVEVALGEVLEAAFAADAEQNAVTIERTLAKARRLEAVGSRREKMHRLDDGLAPRSSITEPQTHATVVEANEAACVRVAREARRLRELLPEDARARVVALFLERDRRVSEPACRLELARGSGVILPLCGNACTIERRLHDALRLADVSEEEQRSRERAM